MRRYVSFGIKAIVSIALIWYLLSTTPFSEILESLRSAELIWLVAAFLMIYLGKALTTFRWQAILNAQGIRVPFFRLMASVFVGQFFNSLLPTTVGGDASRAYDVASYSKEAATSVTSVVMDRLIGVFALSLLALVSLLIGYQIGEDISFFIFPVVVVFLMCLASLVLILNATFVSKVNGVLKRLHLTKLAKQIEIASISLRELSKQKDVLLLAFLVSLALQINVVLFYFMISVSLHLEVSLLYYFMIVTIALVVLLLPFSINGIGVREGIFVYLLGELGVASQDAIALSWISFGLMFPQGVTGGIILAVRGFRLRDFNPEDDNVEENNQTGLNRGEEEILVLKDVPVGMEKEEIC